MQIGRRGFLGSLLAVPFLRLEPPKPQTYGWISKSVPIEAAGSSALVDLLNEKIRQASISMDQLLNRGLFTTIRYEGVTIEADEYGFESGEWKPDPYWRDAEKRFHI